MSTHAHLPAIQIPAGYQLIGTLPSEAYAVNTLVKLYYLRSTIRFHVYRNSAEGLHMHVPKEWHKDGKANAFIQIQAQAPLSLNNAT